MNKPRLVLACLVAALVVALVLSLARSRTWSARPLASASPAPVAEATPGPAPVAPGAMANRDARAEAPAPVIELAKLEGKRARQQQAAARLTRDVQVDFDETVGAPRFISSPRGFLAQADGSGANVPAVRLAEYAGDDRLRMVKAFLAEHAAVFAHGSEVLEDAALVRDYETPHNGMRTFVWQQKLDGLRVFESTFQAHLTRRGDLVNVASRFLPNPAAAASERARSAVRDLPRIDVRAAVSAAGQDVGEVMTPAQVVAEGVPEGASRKQRLRSTRLLNVSAELVWLPRNEAALELCWEVVFTSKARGEMFRTLVEAESGAVRVRQGLTEYISDATYLVFTSDSPSPFSPGHPTPLTTQPATVARTSVTTPALNVTASPNGWIDDGVNETRGNNVDAHADVNADDVADLPRPQGSPTRVFAPALDLSQPPSVNREAAVVDLFYWCNRIHDRYYELGFTEAAGNFQINNFGRGGAGNDAVQADAQDGSGTNNANFSTPPDGSPGRMQMYVFTAPTPDRDGDFDHEIVIHEYTHGLSNRLVGGGVGLSALSSRGMGEGWSDFYALSLLSEAGDNVNGNYSKGGYATFQLDGMTTNYYYGIRRYPYSTDQAKNPLTFRDIDPSQASPHTGIPLSPRYPSSNANPSAVHGQGEVWCVTLWGARANLVARHGFPAGNDLMLQLVTDGMKLAPANPNFIQARNAILQADSVNNGGANHGDLWNAFAARGMGATATAPASTTTTGVVESYQIPDDLSIAPNTTAAVTGMIGGPFTPGTVTYTLTNIGTAPLTWSAGEATAWFSLSATSGTLAPGANTTVVATILPAANALVAGSYPGAITFANTVTNVEQTRTINLQIEPLTNLIASETWESGAPGAAWSITGTNTHRTLVTTANVPHGGTYHLTMDSSVDVSPSRNEATWTVNLAGRSNVQLRFWVKMFNDEANGPPAIPFTGGADFDGVAISADGTTWYEVQPLRTLVSAWTRYVVDLDAAIAARGLSYSSTFKIRFNHYDDYGITTDGFAFDDIELIEVVNSGLTLALPASVNENAAPVAATVTAVPIPTSDLAVSLVSSLPGGLGVPASVTIPAGQTSANFSLSPTDDALLNGTRKVTITATATGLPTGARTIDLNDNETTALTVTLPAGATEGDTGLTGTVVSANPVGAAIEVTLSSNDPSELLVPAAVTIPAGQTSVVFPLTVVDDSANDETQIATITASVAGWTPGSRAMSIFDNDDAIYTITASDRGWYDAIGTHTTTNTNYSTAWSATPAPGREFRSFFVFAIPALAPGETIRSAELRLDNPVNGYGSPDLTETLQFHEVSTPIATLVGGTGGVPVFDDLGDGPALGNRTVSAADNGTSVVIPLNSAFISQAAAAAGGQLAVGAQLITLARTPNVREGIFGFSTDTNVTRLVLTTSNAAVTVALPPSVMEGGAAGLGTVTATPASASDLVVTLINSQPAQLNVPATVTIPAGQSSVDFQVSAVNDTLLDGSPSVPVNASASGYQPVPDSIMVIDDEAATLTLALPASATEGDATVSGTLTASAPVGVDVGVALTSSAVADVTVPASVTIPAGQTSASVPVTIVNDTRIDGAVPATITATVTNWTTGSASITALDNETSTLALSTPGALREGGASVNVTVSIPGTLGANLVVALSSSDTGEATVPANTTILAGQTSATFAITPVEDPDADGTQPVTITATASSFTTATTTANVADNDAHHFSLSAVPSPQAPNAPFALSVTARDVNDATITTFNSPVALSAAGAGGALVVSPTTLTGWVNGVWSGTPSIGAAGTNVVVTASDGQGHTGASNAFDVIAGLPQRFMWGTIASPQFVDGPFPVTLRAVDSAGNTAPTFTGPASLAAAPVSAPRTIGTGTLTALAPFHGSNHEYRLQALYPASEVGPAATLSALAVNIATASPSTFNNFTVRLKHSALTTLTGTTFDTTGWTEVFRGNVTPSTTGWLTFAFTTEFAYDGTSSLLVDFTFDNPGTATTAYTYYTSLSNRALYAFSSGTSGDPRTWTTAAGTTAVVPNLRLFPAPGGALPVAPATTGAFVNGEWTGLVSVPFTTGGVTLRATSGALSGDSNAFAVQTAQLPSGTGTVFTEDFETGMLNPAYWATTGTGPFRTQVTTANLPHGGTRHLTMDSTTDSVNARNEATLTLNLAGRTGVVLRFWAKMFDDEANGPPAAPFVGGADFDGVAMSADGTNWWEVQALRSPTITNNWAEFTVNLDAAIAARGIAYNGAFKLRFNQFDNFTITTDGIAIDDIVITANAPPSTLTVTAPAQVVEGSGSANASVAVSSAPVGDLALTLSSKAAAKIAVPPSVIIPAGQTSATFLITVLDDSFVDGLKTVILTATGPGLAETGAAVQVVDNDGGALSLALPATASESTGALSGSVQLSLTPLVPITVALTSNDPGELAVPASVIVPAGQTSVSFTAFTSDDGLVDGAQSVMVTAASAGWSHATASVSVLDSGRDATLDWPTFGNGPGHTGYQPITLGGNSFQPAWTRSFAPITGINPVAIESGKVFVTPVSSSTTYLAALDATTGAELWRKNFAAANSINPPTVSAGKVYVQRGNHGSDTQLWCVAAATGSTVWSTPHGAQWERYFAPTVMGDGVWINGGYYGGLYGFDTSNGTQRFFNSTLEQYDQWTPAWHNGTVYTWIAGIFRAHDPHSGAILWSHNLGWSWNGWSMYTAAVLSENQAFVVGSPNFYAIDLSTRTTAWSATGTFKGTPAVANGKTYVLIGSDVRAYDRATGALVRTYSTGNTAIAGQPIVTDDTLIVAATANTYVFDLATGTLRQTLAAGGAPSLANGVLYLTSGGVVQTFRPAGQASLTVSLPTTTVSENAAPFTATVTLSAAPGSDTVIRLSSGGSTRVTVPANVTIPAGQASTTFPVTIVNDTLINGSENVGISASAATYLILGDTADLAVTDDETAVLTLGAPASTTEGAAALTGMLTLSAPPAVNVTVDLASSDTTELTVPASVFVNAGETSVTFPITVINDTLIDGTQTVQLTASVPGWTSGSATVAVLDNETNTLTLSAPGSLTEGANGTGTVSLGGTLATALTVNLSSSDSTQATVPASITIAAGSSSGTFSIAAVDDAAQDGAQTVTITATASGFPTATRNVSILDNDVHHFAFGTITSPKATGTPFSVTITAQDVNNATVFPFNGTAALSATGTAGSIAFTPATTGTFSSGTWTGSVTVNTASTAVRLAATTSGATGQSAPFDVSLSPALTLQPTSVALTLTQGAFATRTVAVQNTGGGTLTWSIATSLEGDADADADTTEEKPTPLAAAPAEGEDAVPPALTAVLGNLNANQAAVRGAIPSRFAFTEGVTGNSISDGGNDMYDGGNYLATNLGSNLAYSDNVILANAALGTGGQYFTRKYDGLWVFAADVAGLSQFTVSGDLGADGSGATDGIVLTQVRGGVTYRGFVKRVYNAGDPSVNHLIILADAPAATHEAATNTNDDYHRVLNLTGVTRIYYALFAGTAGAFISNASMDTIMTAFLDAVLTPVFVTPSPTSGSVAAGGSQDLTLSITTAGLASGSYTRSIVLTTNDPARPSATLPVTLTVVAPPNLAVTPASAFVASGLRGGPFSPTTQNYTLNNSGGLPLDWTASKTAPWLDLTPASGTLAAGASVNVVTALNANANNLAPASHGDTITFTNTTNGIGNTTRTVSLAVNAAGELAVTPASNFTASGPYGGPFTPAVQAYTLGNSGDAPLAWTATPSQPWLQLSRTSGTLAVGATTTIDVTHAAGTLAPGNHTATLTFTNTSNGRGNAARAAALDITLPSPVLAPEPPITPETANTIAWSGVNGVNDYEVQMSTNAAFASAVSSGPVLATAHTFTGLADDTVYYFRVRARFLTTAPAQTHFSAWSNIESSRQFNAPPTIGALADQAILEDGATALLPFALGDDSTAPGALVLTVFSSNPALVPIERVTLSGTGANRGVQVAPLADLHGSTRVTLRVTDEGGKSSESAFHVVAASVNDAPLFSRGADQSVLEDGAAQVVHGWATTISAGPANESAQALDFIVSHNRPALFAVAPALSADGTLTYTPAPEANGTATVTVRLHDNGGTADGGSDTSAPQIFTIAVGAVNDAPSFVKGADQSVLEDAGPQTVANWATAISAGPANESAQALDFTVSHDRPVLFAVAPALSPDGTLTYTPATDANGTATVTVRLHDNGGTADGGSDTSAPQTFTIAIRAVNDAPAFVKGASQSSRQNSGPQSVPGWATAISPGPADEAAQTLAFDVTSDQPALFAVAPALSPDGTLTYTPAADTTGTATVTVVLRDDGGTADGGHDESAAQTILISTTFVNDAPSFVCGSDLETAQDAGPQIIAAWATQISAGPADEAAQLLDFLVETDAAALFTTPPAIAPGGTLSYTPAPAASGTATITVRLHDNGGTADGGSDTSAAQTFTIAVTTFAEETGTYNGLVRAAPGAALSAERVGVLRFVLNRRGAFTSQLTLGNKVRAAKGRVDLSGVTHFGAKGTDTWSFARGRKQAPLTIALKVDVADGTDTLAGVVRDGAAEFATIEADRALFTAKANPAAPLRNVPPELLGRYTVAFLAPPPATPEDAELYPQGAGTGTLKLTADGRVRLAATLADGTKISADNALSKHVVFPFHHADGRGHSISGSLAFRDVPAVSDVDGALWWFHPARDGQFYPAGWPTGLATALIGAKYTPPAKGAPMIPGLPEVDADGNALLQFTDGGLLAPLAQNLGIGVDHRVTALAPNASHVVVKMNAKKGTFGGSFIHPVTAKKCDFQGVVLQKQAAGAGAFRTKFDVGGVSLTPQ